MSEKETLDQLKDDLAVRAQALIDAGHTPYAIMKDAFAEVKRLGSMAGAISIINSGKLNASQLEAAERIAVKIMAVIAQHKRG